MHADIAADIESAPGADLLAEQRACDRWRQEFNHVRPHEALQQRTPAELYKPIASKPGIRVPSYPTSWLVRRTAKNGELIVNNEHYFLSRALAGHRIGLQPLSAFKFRAWFYEVDLGELEILGAAVEAVFDRGRRAHRG